MPEYPKSVRNRASEMMPPRKFGEHYTTDAINDAICAALTEQPPTEQSGQATPPGERAEQAEPGELAQWQIAAAKAFITTNSSWVAHWSDKGFDILARALFTPPPSEPEDARLPIWREFMAGVCPDAQTAQEYRDHRHDHDFSDWIADHDKAKEAGL